MTEAERQDPKEDVLANIPAEFVVEEISGIKALADPMRVAILKALYVKDPQTGRTPARTTKEVCGILGESRTTKIYHHLKLLLAAGLIQKVRTTRRGNLLEDHFGPTARLIRLSPTLLREAQVGEGGWIDAITSLLDATRSDIVALDSNTPVRDMRFAHREFTLTHAQAHAFREELDALLAKYEHIEPSKETSTESIRAVAVVYPAPPKIHQ